MKRVFNKSLRFTAFMTLICSVLFLCGCGTAKRTQSDKPLIVTVSYIQYDLARAVAGDDANIHMIMKPGAEMHGFEPSLSDIRLMASADLFVYNGGESDVWVDRVFDAIEETSDNEIKKVKLTDYALLLSEEVPFGSKESQSHSHMHDHSEHEDGECHHTEAYDEHIWLSPVNAIRMTEGISEALSEINPENSVNYKKRSEEYCNKIYAIHDELSRICNDAAINTVAVADRFPYLYLVKEYDLSYVAAFSGCSPEADASPSVLVTLTQTVREKNIDTVFYTEQSDHRMANAVCEETGAKPVMLHSCQTISKQDFENGKTYVDIMNENATKLREALN